jgi:hypothetical protein
MSHVQRSSELLTKISNGLVRSSVNHDEEVSCTGRAGLLPSFNNVRMAEDIVETREQKPYLTAPSSSFTPHFVIF